LNRSQREDEAIAMTVSRFNVPPCTAPKDQPCNRSVAVVNPYQLISTEHPVLMTIRPGDSV
jgi:hypothetical protein